MTLTASPATGSEVTWGGDCASAGHALSCDVAMSSAADVTIAFTLLRLTLSVDITGIGSVDVSADGATTTCDTDCAPVFDYGTPIHLDARPGTGQYLAAWGGDCTADGQGGCDLTIEADATVTAEYSPSDMPVTLTTDGNGAGSATWSPVIDPTCQADCTVSECPSSTRCRRRSISRSGVTG